MDATTGCKDEIVSLNVDAFIESKSDPDGRASD